MKRKFEIINKFLRGYGLDEISFSWTWYEYDTGEPEWNWYSTSLQYQKNTRVPENIIGLIIEIIKDYWVGAVDGVSSETETYRIELEIYPKESKWVITSQYEETVAQPESHDKESTNEELNEFMDSRDIEFINAEYDGNGDSGWISKVEIDGKDLGDPNQIWQNQDYKIITDELYSFLENRVSGWEIDDGSRGTIEILKKKGKNAQFSLEHTWHMREFFDSDKEVLLTKEVFSDEE